MRVLSRYPSLALAAIAVCAALPAGCGGNDGPIAVEGENEGEPTVVLPAGDPPESLVVEDLRVGRGREAKPGDEMVIEFVLVYITGERIESTWRPGGKPFTITLGAKQVNPGWQRGMRGIRVGGRRQLIVPPRISSWDRAATEGGPEETLVYVIDLIAIA